MGTKAQMELLLKELTTFSKKANENFEMLIDIARTKEHKLEYERKEIENLQEEVKDLQSNISPKVASDKEQVEYIRNIVNDIPNPQPQTWADVASSSKSSAQNVARTIINAMKEDVVEVEDDNTKQQIWDFASMNSMTINEDDIEKAKRLGKKRKI